MQITSYLDHNTISRSSDENPTRRHFTSRDVISHFFVKNCWKTADVSNNEQRWVKHFSFFSSGIIRAFIWCVNKLSMICGSLFIAVIVEVLILADFSWRHRQKCWRQQEMTSRPKFFLQNKKILLCSIILTSFKS